MAVAKKPAQRKTTVRRRTTSTTKKPAPRRRRMSSPKTKGKRAMSTTVNGFIGGAAADLLQKSLVGVNLPSWVAPAAPLAGAWVTDRFFGKTTIAAGMAGASAAGVVDVLMGTLFNDAGNRTTEEAEFMRPNKELEVVEPGNPMALQDYGYASMGESLYSSNYANYLEQ